MNYIKKTIIQVYCRRVLAVAAAASLAIMSYDASARTVTGSVVDEYGNPLSNVVVKQRGTDYSTTTNDFGLFEIDLDRGGVLTLSHGDYLAKEVNVKRLKNHDKGFKLRLEGKNVTTTPEKVVGPLNTVNTTDYIGSVATVNNTLLNKQMNTTIIPSLMGRLPGLNIMQYRGSRLHISTANTHQDLIGSMPVLGTGAYSDNTEFSISSRGTGFVTYVDGVQRDLFAIDPEMIESVSIQKDALSNMFMGMKSSRNALVITTKNPKSRGFQVSFTAKMGINSSIKKLKPLSTYQYAYLLNEALQNDGKTPIYSYDDFEKFRSGSSLYTHPDVNWYDQILGDNAISQSYNINVSGGNNFAQYFVSAGMYGDNGLFRDNNDKYKTKLTLNRYSIDSKVNINVTQDFTAKIALLARIEEGNQPGGSGTGYSDILLNIYRTPNNAYPIKNPNGTWGGNVSFNNNLYSQAFNSGYIIDDTRDILGSIDLKYDFDRVAKGLSVRALGTIAVQNKSVTNRTMRSPVYLYSEVDGKPGYSMFGSVSSQTNTYTAVSTYQQMYGQLSVDYERQFDLHHLKASLSGDTRQELINYDLPRIPSNLMQTMGYDYDKKYFVQLAMTESYYNRYAENKRWGTFYAAGLGWDISRENFMDGTNDWLDQLKLRAVYGRTGNGIDNTGYYTYYQTYENNAASWYSMGTSQGQFRTTYESALANPYITWEKANKVNVGIDAQLFNGRLSIAADYYNDKYFDLLQARGKSIEIIGQSYPAENIGKQRRTGVELQATWQDNIADFNYFITANWSMEDSKILFMDEQNQPYDYLRQTGRAGNAMFGYICDGFFSSDEEIANSPVIKGYSNIRPGDLKYRDLNKDGVIDDFDRCVIGGDKPTSYFGLEYGFNWKGLEFSMLWQGVYNREFILSDWNLLEGFQQYGQHYTQAYDIVLNRWTPETAQTALLPRLSAGGNSYNHYASTFWLKDGDFIRLRNVEVGYTLPESFCNNHLGGLRPKVFVSAQNMLTFAGCDWVDPEVRFTSYPLQRTWSMGVNLKF